MKNRKVWFLSFGLVMGMQGLVQAQEQQTETKQTSSLEATAEQDFRAFKDWVRTQTSKVATTTKAEWPSIKSDFKRQSDKVESSFQNLSENSKREFLDLKTDFNNLETKEVFYDEVPLQAEEVRLREKELLKGYSNIQAIKATEMRTAYITFMQNVREKRKTWIPRDWDYAEYILQNLGKRKAAVESSLTTLDEIKIRSLIGEFHTLRSGQEFKEKQAAKKAANSN